MSDINYNICKRCGKDISKLVYKAGEEVIIKLNYLRVRKYPHYKKMGKIESYCPECIKILSKGLIKVNF